MRRNSANAAARREADRARRALADDIRRLREDAGVGRAQLSRQSGVDLGFLMSIEDGHEHPSVETYAKIAVALGADLAMRLYPNTGPAIRDRHQAPIVEALLEQLHPRWQPYAEVPVRNPSRGWIDLVLHAERAGCVVAVEVESAITRLEQLLRWHAAKVEALPSWPGWATLGAVTTRSQLLLVRSTRATRDVGRAFAHQLAIAYPAHPADAIASLRSPTTPWPGSALVWVDVRGGRVRFAERR